MIKRMLILSFVLFVASQLTAQENSLRFTHVKSIGEQKTVYFHINGLQDDEMSEALLERLLQDPLIFEGRIFKTPKLQDRCQLYMAYEIDAAYVLSILKEFNLDYEYTTVSRNGHLESNQASSQSNPGATPSTPVLINGFPEYEDTGNHEADRENYQNKKQKWVEENPEKYQEYINSKR
ncbi:MAG: hypothetical protein PF448_01790 [Bacteroidales bacterium]|jgi:hypothetical protein|nr:hypothetical protein [Bacteroidales bacterium]